MDERESNMGPTSHWEAGVNVWISSLYDKYHETVCIRGHYISWFGFKRLFCREVNSWITKNKKDLGTRLSAYDIRWDFIWYTKPTMKSVKICHPQIMTTYIQQNTAE